jgi:CDP-diglyceride synthetase
MKNIKTIIGFVCGIFISVSLIALLIYHILNPELTTMQMFLKFWYIHLLNFTCFFGLFWVDEKDF